MSKRNIFPYILALMSATGSAFWAVLSLLFVNSVKVSPIVSLDAVNILLLFFSVIAAAAFARRKGAFSASMVKLAVLEGALYVAANLLMYYALSYVQAFPLTQAFFYGSIIVFAFLVRKVNKSKTGFGYLPSTALVFLGIVAIMFGVYGSGFSSSPFYLISLFTMIVLYGLASYFAFYSMKKGNDPVAFLAMTSVTEAVITNAIVASQPGMLGELFNMSSAAWFYAAAIATAIVVSFLLYLYVFRAVKRKGARVINTINMITNMQFIGIVLYSLLFLSLNWISVVVGGVLLLAGIILLQLSK